MKLIIAEKPSLGRNIANVIGIVKKEKEYIECKNDYVVTHCLGHLMEIRQPKNYEENQYKKWSEYSLPFIPNKFIYEVKDDIGVKHQLKAVKELMKKADLIINCGDADREGQIIVDNLLQFNNKNVPVKRLWLPEQTDDTIRKELNNMKDNSYYKNLQQEGYARAYMDYLLGHNLTIILTNLSGQLLHAGRVLVPIVKFIYDRNNEIKNFVVEKYYSVENEKDIKLTCSKKFKTEKEAKEHASKLNLEKAIVKQIETKALKKQSKKLFSLSDLQSQISKSLKISFADSLKIIQDLYEQGYLTYPRTNTEYLAENEKDKVKDILKVLNNEDLEFKDSKKIFDDSKIESHSAITITTKIPDKFYNDNYKNVYDIVKTRFISNFVKEDCVVDETTMTIHIGDESFKIKGSIIKQKGFLKYDEEEAKKIKSTLPNLSENDSFGVDFKVFEKETTPPSKVNEAELSKFLKNPFKKDEEVSEEEMYKDILQGVEIGTEATRTGIIDKCVKAGYLTLNKGVFDITNNGIYLIDQLIKFKINLFKEKSVEFSKLQKKIYKNELKIEDLIFKIKTELNEIVINTKDIKPPQNEMQNDEVIEIKSPKGTFYKGKFLNEERIIAANSKYFDNELKITKNIAIELFEGKAVEFSIKDKFGKGYKQKLKLILNGKYINFIKE